MRGPSTFVRAALTLAVAACSWAAAGDPEWRAMPEGEIDPAVEAEVHEIVGRTILGDEVDPLIDALPSAFADNPTVRRNVAARITARRAELRQRLGTVSDWHLAEVLRDQHGGVKLRVRFYEPSDDPPAAKRPFRSLSFVFRPIGGRLSLVWIGLWDPASGTWDVL